MLVGAPQRLLSGVIDERWTRRSEHGGRRRELGAHRCVAAAGLDVVSEVTPTGQRSPECFRVDWLDGHDPAQGAQVRRQARGCNRLRFVGVWCSR